MRRRRDCKRRRSRRWVMLQQPLFLCGGGDARQVRAITEKGDEEVYKKLDAATKRILIQNRWRVACDV